MGTAVRAIDAATHWPELPTEIAIEGLPANHLGPPKLQRTRERLFRDWYVSVPRVGSPRFTSVL